MPTLARHRLDDLEPRCPWPNEPTGSLGEPPPGPDKRPRVRSMKPDRSFSKIVHNTSRIVCKRACRRRRCHQAGRWSGGVAASYGNGWPNARRPPVERQGVVPGGVPATHCNGAQSVVVPDSAEGPFGGKL